MIPAATGQVRSPNLHRLGHPGRRRWDYHLRLPDHHPLHLCPPWSSLSLLLPRPLLCQRMIVLWSQNPNSTHPARVDSGPPLPLDPVSCFCRMDTAADTSQAGHGSLNKLFYI